jgi:zinc protease
MQVRAARILVGLAAGLGLASAAASQVAPAPQGPATAATSSWQSEGSDIPADPQWRTGTLPNGVRYAVRRNTNPPGAFSIRVRMDVGGFMESDAEQGWAHMVEHMAFRGSSTLADGEGIRIWQRMGASFGTDTNASTTQSATTYRLDIPKSDPATIDRVSGILADMMENASIDPKLLDIERKVVLAEMGLRKTPSGDKARKVGSALFEPGLLSARRDVIGSAETLNGATADKLRAFYHTWYRPDRAVVVIAGDADPAVLEAAVKKAFGGWTATGKAPAEPDYGSLDKPAVPAMSLIDPQAPNRLQIVWSRPVDDGPVTVAKVQHDYVSAVAAAIISRRIAAEARKAESLIGGNAGRRHVRHNAEQMVVSANVKPGTWRQGLDTVFASINGALAMPPGQAEIDEQLARMHESYARRVVDEASATSSAFANAYIDDVDQHDVTPAATFYRDTFEAMRPAITADAVEKALHEMFAPEPRLLVSQPMPLDGGDSALIAALSEAKAVAGGSVAAIRTASLDELKLPRKPGKVVASETIPDLDMDRVRFRNGTILLMKKTAFEKGTVEVRVRIGRGRLNGPAAVTPLDWSSGLMSVSGLGPFTPDELTRLMSGRQLAFVMRPAFSAETLAARTNPDDLADALKLMTGAITKPRFAASALVRMKSQFEADYRSVKSQPGSALAVFGPALLYGGDKRIYSLPDPAAVEALTLPQVRLFWRRKLAEGPVTVEVVGDLDRDATIAAVARSFGALPHRSPVNPRTVDISTRPSKPGRAIITHRGAPDQAMYFRYWPTIGRYADVEEARALRLAAQIVETRLTEQFRAQSGGTYSPSVSSDQSDELPAMGLFIAGAQIERSRIDEFKKKLLAVVADLSAREPDADELDRARVPVLSVLARGKASSNAFWLGAVDSYVTDPRYLDTFRTLDSGYRAITGAQIRAVAAKYLTSDSAIEIVVEAEQPAKAAP